jgi:hypothetical protein
LLEICFSNFAKNQRIGRVFWELLEMLLDRKGIPYTLMYLFSDAKYKRGIVNCKASKEGIGNTI